MKITRVVPVFKGGLTDHLINYRPISILPTVSKIFERSLYNRMWSFINKNNILSNNQFGFCANHNTELAVLHAQSSINLAHNIGIPSLGLFIDISKAFNSINHSILLDKIQHLGFRGVTHIWFSSYLSTRYQI